MVQVAQMLSAVAVAASRIYSPAPHGVTAAQRRSLVAVGANASYSSPIAPHTVSGAHALSVVAVGGEVSHCAPPRHTVLRVQVVSCSAVQAPV